MNHTFDDPTGWWRFHVMIDGVSFFTNDNLPNCMLWFGRLLERTGPHNRATLIEIRELFRLMDLPRG